MNKLFCRYIIKKTKLFSKTRDKKIAITDIAIKKVPFIEYKGFTDIQNKILQDLARQVLIISKDKLNSNEVAITTTIEGDGFSDKRAVVLGNEHTIDLYSDPETSKMLHSPQGQTVVIIHNHPSTQTFSLDDLLMFLDTHSVVMMVVVTNQGTIHYIRKEKKYNHESARKFLLSVVRDVKRDYPLWFLNSKKYSYVACTKYLALCSEKGLYYH